MNPVFPIPQDTARMPEGTRGIDSGPGRFITLWACQLLLLIHPLPSHAGEAQDDPGLDHLRTGFTRDAFQGVNRTDAETALKVFARTIGIKRGHSVSATVQMFDKASEIEAALARQSVNLLILDTWTYLELKPTAPVDAAFVSSDGKFVTKKQIIVTRRDSGLNSLESLRGRSLNVHFAANASLGMHWLATRMAEEKLGSPSNFFGTMESLAKPSSVILPVFFKKKDACLVDAAGFALISELNPQVGNSLQPIASSDPLVNAVICLNRSAWTSDRFRTNTLAGLAELHLDPAGQQVLTLFRSGPLVPFEERFLATARTLRAASDRLQKEGQP